MSLHTHSTAQRKHSTSQPPEHGTALSKRDALEGCLQSPHNTNSPGRTMYGNDAHEHKYRKMIHKLKPYSQTGNMPTFTV